MSPWGYPLSYMQSQARPLVQMCSRITKLTGAGLGLGPVDSLIGPTPSLSARLRAHYLIFFQSPQTTCLLAALVHITLPYQISTSDVGASNGLPPRVFADSLALRIGSHWLLAARSPPGHRRKQST